MSKIGLGGKLGDNFKLITRNENPPNSSFPLVTEFFPSSDLLCRLEMQRYSSLHSSVFESLSFAVSGDHASGLERFMRRLDAEEREQQIAYLKQLVTRPWNWVASIFSPIPCSPAISIADHNPDPIPIITTDLRPGNATTTSVLDWCTGGEQLIRTREQGERGESCFVDVLVRRCFCASVL